MIYYGKYGPWAELTNKNHIFGDLFVIVAWDQKKWLLLIILPKHTACELMWRFRVYVERKS